MMDTSENCESDQVTLREIDCQSEEVGVDEKDIERTCDDEEDTKTNHKENIEQISEDENNTKTNHKENIEQICEDENDTKTNHEENTEQSEDEKEKDAKAGRDAQHQFAVPALPTITKTKNKKEETKVNDEVNKVNEIENVASEVSKKLIEVVNTDSDNVSNTHIKNNESKNKASAQNHLFIKKETCKDKKTNFPYTVPSWGGAPGDSKKYSLTILKEGIVKDTIDLTGKSTITFGRHPNACDVLVEHPSCSRYHAVLQYCVEEKDVRKVGYYLYDLGSTHGCCVNKEKVRPKVYVRVRVGYQIKFGASSRRYIVEGPEEDQEDEMDMEDVRKQREKNKLIKAKTLTSSENGSSGDNDDGASWGFGEDAEEEELDLKDLMEMKKSVEVKDPKKTLKGFFEREGLDFEYEMSERGRGNSVVHVAQVRLPIESSFGVEIIAEGTSANKKDAVLNCATDACKIIQAYDMMQNPCKEDERVKRQRELEANDFYDSDDDNYLDRTGSVERKRLKRKQWAGKQEDVEASSHESLKEQLQENLKLLATLEQKLTLSNDIEESEDGDSLDAYMSNIANKLDKKAKNQIKRQIVEVKKDGEKLKKLVEKTLPALPALVVKKKVEETLTKNEKVVKHVINSSVRTRDSENSLKDANAGVTGKEEIENINDTEVTEEKEIENDKEPTSPPKKKKKKKRVYGAAMMPPPEKKDVNKKKVNEADFIEWQPPEGQTGDGKTHLNDKFGY